MSKKHTLVIHKSTAQGKTEAAAQVAAKTVEELNAAAKDFDSAMGYTSSDQNQERVPEAKAPEPEAKAPEPEAKAPEPQSTAPSGVKMVRVKAKLRTMYHPYFKVYISQMEPSEVPVDSWTQSQLDAGLFEVM